MAVRCCLCAPDWRTARELCAERLCLRAVCVCICAVRDVFFSARWGGGLLYCVSTGSLVLLFHVCGGRSRLALGGEGEACCVDLLKGRSKGKYCYVYVLWVLWVQLGRSTDPDQ